MYVVFKDFNLNSSDYWVRNNLTAQRSRRVKNGVVSSDYKTSIIKLQIKKKSTVHRELDTPDMKTWKTIMTMPHVKCIGRTNFNHCLQNYAEQGSD